MAFAVIICLGLSGYGYYRYDRDKRDEAFKQAEESLILSFKENDEFLKEFDEHFVKADKNKIYLEYGKDTIDTVRFIKDKSGESFSIEPETIDLQ